MNRITLEVEQRKETGKGPARRLRAAGQAPRYSMEEKRARETDHKHS